ncbi:MAG: rhodanese-like domain-containing protein, partial [Steroidobacteraceae bacterium]
LPFQELLSPDQTLRDPEALRARFASAGVDLRRPVVTSCGSGLSAAILTLALHVAGLPEGALYDGSWTEWGGRPDTPVTVGQD